MIVKTSPPAFFERLVVKLPVAMRAALSAGLGITTSYFTPDAEECIRNVEQKTRTSLKTF